MFEKLLKRIPTTYRWVLSALLLLVLFLIYTYVVSTGGVNSLTIHQEQWLLHRPLTRFDCVLYQWKYFGEPQSSLVIVLALCGLCLLLGYRRRTAFVVMLLLVVALGGEYLGKQYVVQYIPSTVSNGLTMLYCPQIHTPSSLQRVQVTLGMWWFAPPAPYWRVKKEQIASNAPLDEEDAIQYNSYPSGHSSRWMFIGLIACWLAWRQVKRRSLRRLLMCVALALAFGGGLLMFYTGTHLITDVIGGYLLGACLACCAIAFLRVNETRNRRQRPLPSCSRSQELMELNHNR